MATIQEGMSINSTDDRMLPVYQNIVEMELPEIIGMADKYYFSFDDVVEREQVKQFFISRAEKISENALEIVRNLFKAIERKERDLKRNKQKKFIRAYGDYWETLLERDKNGNIRETINNYCTIMEYDSEYSGVKFNLIKNAAEVHSVTDGVISCRNWEDADEVSSLKYIEEKYKIYSESKHSKALISLFKSREYNPVIDIVESIQWDGTERCEELLIHWMKCDDTPYAREVSRLIFSGGINRLYNPGCKFDDVPVLIGTKQGEGKSTIVKWLAINDSFKNDVTQFDGQQAIEQLEGGWICEITELLALTKIKDQEAAKSFITRDSDKYRKPWGKNISVLPRRCTFIGTTNNRRFLKDKTGNRRYYPIEVHSSAYDLYAHEQECRDYIIQCWGEAREKFKAGNMPNFANESLTDDYKDAQSEAMEDDWRVGAIEEFLSSLHKGDKVCSRQLQREALTIGDDKPHDPDMRESREIGDIMDKMDGWERIAKTSRFGSYGVQRGWIKVAETAQNDDDGERLPF